MIESSRQVILQDERQEIIEVYLTGGCHSHRFLSAYYMAFRHLVRTVTTSDISTTLGSLDLFYLLFPFDKTMRLYQLAE